MNRSKHNRHSLLILAVFALLISGCGKQSKTETSSKAKQVFDPMSLTLSDPELIKGREIWMNTCTACHLRGLVGAPKIGDVDAWKPRIAQGMETLFSHAINGYIGPEMTEMPARGGFSELSDEEVKLAVRFVVKASQ